MSTTRSSERSNRYARGRMIRQIVVFAMLGSLMFASKVIMEVLPNIHLLSMLTVLYTVVYRARALIPLYVYVLMNGVYAGFAAWWVPYLYVWTLLWAVAMLIPRSIPPTAAKIIYPVICSLHGFAYGILYAPGQALLFGYSFEEMVLWIIAGAGFDITMGIGNLFAGLLIYPLSRLLIRLERGSRYSLI